jgi:hypothetical protein
MKQKTKQIVALFLSAFVLMFFALSDNFPIVTSDSGTYISSGFTLHAPQDRPIFYGLFIRFTSLGAHHYGLLYLLNA